MHIIFQIWLISAQVRIYFQRYYSEYCAKAESWQDLLSFLKEVSYAHKAAFI